MKTPDTRAAAQDALQHWISSMRSAGSAYDAEAQQRAVGAEAATGARTQAFSEEMASVMASVEVGAVHRAQAADGTRRSEREGDHADGAGLQSIMKELGDVLASEKKHMHLFEAKLCDRLVRYEEPRGQSDPK